MYRAFHGKILLFGEYTIITGSKALVAPLDIFSGRLVIPDSGIPGDNDTRNKEALESNQSLYQFSEFLKQEQDKGSFPFRLDLQKMQTEIERGLYFKSSIPVGYGVGSSAALVAAVYDAFSVDKIDLIINSAGVFLFLKNVFSFMESYFHGTSSGFDPVCSFTGETILLDGKSIGPARIPQHKDQLRLFLLDTGIKGETAPLVEDFNTRISSDPQFSFTIKVELTNLVNNTIRCFLDGTLPENSDLLNQLSGYQLDYFSKMIPENIRKIWETGLLEKSYTLKLCGSGGGGFFIGFTNDWDSLGSITGKGGYKTIPLEL